jgi:hypothetical protein
MKHHKIIILILLCLCPSVFLKADPGALADEIDPAPLDERLIKENIKIRAKLDNLANNIDLALSNKDHSTTVNPTKIIIRNQFGWGEGGAFNYQPALDLNLHLPNLEKKWKLKFTTYDEDQETRGVNKNRIKPVPINNNYGGSVGFFQNLGNINVEFQPRVELRNGIQVSYISKFTTKLEAPHIVVHPEAQLFARSDSGVGQYFSLDTDFLLSSSTTFTIINEEQYLDLVNIFSTNNGVAIGHVFNDRMSQNVSMIFESLSRPNYHLERYTVATGFSQKLYKNILHYSIQPYLAFSRSLDFKGSPGLNFEFDLIF